MSEVNRLNTLLLETRNQLISSIQSKDTIAVSLHAEIRQLSQANQNLQMERDELHAKTQSQSRTVADLACENNELKKRNNVVLQTSATSATAATSAMSATSTASVTEQAQTQYKYHHAQAVHHFTHPPPPPPPPPPFDVVRVGQCDPNVRDSRDGRYLNTHGLNTHGLNKHGPHFRSFHRDNRDHYHPYRRPDADFQSSLPQHRSPKPTPKPTKQDCDK